MTDSVKTKSPQNPSPKLSPGQKDVLEAVAKCRLIKSASDRELFALALQGGPIGKTAESELVMHRGYDFDEVDSYVNG